MLRLSKLTDYGLLLLARFARDGEGKLHNARDLAEATDLPLPTVSKLLKVMTRGGLLVSHRGVAGGYALSRPSRELTVAEIIAVLEGGPFALTTCSEEHGACEYARACDARPNMQLINQAIVGALQGVRLSDLVERSPPGFLTLGGEGGASLTAKTTARRGPA